MTIVNRPAIVAGMANTTSAAKLDRRIPEIMSMTEVAALHGVSRQAVHKWITSGKLPARQAGTTWVVRRVVAEGMTVDGDVIELPADEGDTPPGQ